ncbi:hypothetical protein BP5796_10875 [Coleophoma crateriformis]|uniref:Uncharacterized protein n=1 Tax=Coleophoma crateriformis TaxID=565419 RepID=A0A3D8QL76_9HELO|nr:hypothetical protein BP5796_10875 [Coleophoma crateriformis]
MHPPSFSGRTTRSSYPSAAMADRALTSKRASRKRMLRLGSRGTKPWQRAKGQAAKTMGRPSYLSTLGCVPDAGEKGEVWLLCRLAALAFPAKPFLLAWFCFSANYWAVCLVQPADVRAWDWGAGTAAIGG